MTLLSVVKEVCANVGVMLPQSVFSGITGNRTMQEMVSHANEMAQRIAYDQREWNKLKKTHTITGDGATEAWPLPDNYKRMLLTTNVWRSTSTQTPMRFVPDTDQWLNYRNGGYGISADGGWTMLGGQIHIYPVLGADETAYFAYLDKNCVALNSGGFGDVFLNDLDSFALDERLLKLGMIAQWKQSKGSAYAEDMATFEIALANIAGRDSPSPIIIGRSVRSADNIAYPWMVPS